jgi:hypothetical protein
MAKTFTGTVTASVQYTYQKTDSNNSSWNVQERETLSHSEGYTSGDAANKGELLYRERATIGAGANYDLDLYGTLTDVFGDTLNFEVVRTIYVKLITATSGASCRVGPQGVGNPFKEPWGDVTTAYNLLRPDGVLLLDGPTDGWGVETDEQVLRFHNPGASSIQIDILISGTEGDLEESSSSSSSSSSSQSSSSSSSQSSSSSSLSSTSSG